MQNHIGDATEISPSAVFFIMTLPTDSREIDIGGEITIRDGSETSMHDPS